MNERIRELAKQTNTIGDWGEDITEGRYFVYPNIKNLEKFAELIVKECLTIIQYEANGYAEPVWAYEIVNDIKERFDMASHLE